MTRIKIENVNRINYYIDNYTNSNGKKPTPKQISLGTKININSVHNYIRRGVININIENKKEKIKKFIQTYEKINDKKPDIQTIAKKTDVSCAYIYYLISNNKLDIKKYKKMKKLDTNSKEFKEILLNLDKIIIKISVKKLSTKDTKEDIYASVLREYNLFKDFDSNRKIYLTFMRIINKYKKKK